MFFVVIGCSERQRVNIYIYIYRLDYIDCKYGLYRSVTTDMSVHTLKLLIYLYMRWHYYCNFCTCVDITTVIPVHALTLLIYLHA